MMVWLLTTFLTIAAPAATWEFIDLDATTHCPLEAEQTKAVVMIFITTDCPVANSYQPELRRLAEQYGPNGFAFFQIHPDPDTTAEQAAEHAKDFDITVPVVLDPDHHLTQRAGATVTPEAVVIGRDGTILYAGRIDDTWVGFGKNRPEATQHDLKEALDAITAGKEVAQPRTKAIGCFIPDPKTD